MEPTKVCFKCKKRKPLRLFYKHPEMADGHLGKCIVCAINDVHARYNSPRFRPRILSYEQIRSKTPERKAAQLRYAKKRRELNPGKVKANHAVSNAIRDGRLIRQPCEMCGELKSEAHHDDYRKVLSVRWLCFKHHREAHGQKVGV